MDMRKERRRQTIRPAARLSPDRSLRHQGAGVAVVTGNIWLGLFEWLAHTMIDEAKVRGKTTFAQDQALHIACKAVWLAYLVLFATLSHGPSISLWWR